MNDAPWCMKCNIPLELPNSTNKRFLDLKVSPRSKRMNVTVQELDK